jgi:hypothetical protein
MSSNFLSLPGEIRNQIFEYALDEVNGLEYFEESSGLAWLCLSNPDSDASVSDNSSSTTTTSSDTTAMVTNRDGRIIANQMQFVCRQLRWETRGLGILYNTITFKCADPMFLLQLMQELPVSRRHKIHNIVYRPDNPQLAAEHALGYLSKFCRDYPWLNVKFHFSALSPAKPWDFLIVSAIYVCIARNDRTWVRKLSHDDATQQHILAFIDTKAELLQGLQLPPNLRLYPYDKVFDEDAFRKACPKNRYIRRGFIDTLRGGVDDLVAYVKECYANGV